MPLTVLINDEGHGKLPVSLLEDGIRTVMAAEGISEGEISVTFLKDPEIRAMNLQYLEKDSPTDVISFALHGPSEPVLGDVYVGFDQTVRQARELGVELEEELLRVSIHGTLHLLGHDHPEGPDRTESPMFLLQEALLAKIMEDRSSSSFPGESPPAGDVP